MSWPRHTAAPRGETRLLLGTAAGVLALQGAGLPVIAAAAKVVAAGLLLIIQSHQIMRLMIGIK